MPRKTKGTLLGFVGVGEIYCPACNRTVSANIRVHKFTSGDEHFRAECGSCGRYLRFVTRSEIEFNADADPRAVKPASSIFEKPKPIASKFRGDVRCPRCKAAMLRLEGRYGVFFSCTRRKSGCDGKIAGDIPQPENTQPIDREFAAIVRGTSLESADRGRPGLPAGYVSCMVVNPGSGPALAECPF